MEFRLFTDTSRAVSVKADCTPQYVLLLTKKGRLPYMVASDGTHLYPPEAAEIVRRIKRENVARRGQRRTT